jgi:transcriptional regulator with XRE-family HTH domain
MNLRSTDTLRALIAQWGLTHQAVADRAGCSKAFIGHLARGHKESCTPDLAQRIAEVLGVDVDVLFAPTASSDTERITQRRRTAA